MIYVGVRVGNWATIRGAQPFREQHLVAAFGWFLLAIAAPLAGLACAFWVDRRVERDELAKVRQTAADLERRVAELQRERP